MINLTAVIIANATAILLMIILLLGSHKTLRAGMFDEKLFYTMVALTIFQCLIETATFFIDGRLFPGARILSYLLNSGLFIFTTLFSFTWTLYADYKLFKNTSRIKMIYPFVAIPAILITAGSLLNFLIPVFYSISEKNVYTRTSLFLLPTLVTYIYLAYGVILIYAYRNKVGQYLFLPAIIFMIPILLGSLVQFCVYGISLIWIGVAVALVSLYINVQNEASYVDTLSGLFSRQYLNNYLFNETRRIASDSSLKLSGIMLDIDKFKTINDEFGHLVGDEAIASAGKILRSCVSGNGFASRYAGDEFIIIRLIKNEEEVLETMAQIEKATEAFNAYSHKAYQLQFSMGYSLYQGNGDSMDAFLERMDSYMYSSKRKKAVQ